MRKLIFGTAMCLMTGFAFAQSNTSTVEQVGNDNNALVDQSGSNTALVNQGSAVTAQARSNNNTATILQTGSANLATANTIGDRNTTEQIQDGSNNTATAKQGNVRSILPSLGIFQVTRSIDNTIVLAVARFAEPVCKIVAVLLLERA